MKVYISTKGYDFFEMRIKSKSSSAILLVLNESFTVEIYSLNDSNGSYFFRYLFSDLSSDTKYTIAVKQREDEQFIVCKTLSKPKGVLQSRFAVFADLHLNSYNSDYSNMRPERRLYGIANTLAKKYIEKVAEDGVDFIVFPGDILDSPSDKILWEFKDLIDNINVPCYPIIGNHESYGGISYFYEILDLPKEGYYAKTINNTRYIFLNTPGMESLDEETHQYKWLLNELDCYANKINTYIFSHFSLILHPCVQGYRNDGYQQLNNYKDLLYQFKKYKKLRAFIAGHKNVPSRIKVDHVEHILCPQLFQAPCSYTLFDVFEKGFVQTTYEIEEQHYAELSEIAYGNEYELRYGDEESRNYSIIFNHDM